ncbi:MAG: glutamine-hydrolyzing GMP synthase [Bacteroidota bacterium]|nr:glutamine-hydrolyzing GMP synthase [Bacteroidota bacterium]
MSEEKILIIDFGSQYTQLIARKVREMNVFCEIYPFHAFPAIDDSTKGIILSGSPFSVTQPNAPRIHFNEKDSPIPVLGICYGAQLIAQNQGGNVASSSTREYGRAYLGNIEKSNPLLHGINDGSHVWMSHSDTIKKLPLGAKVIASTETVEVAAYQVENSKIWGLQFHPEVAHSLQGQQLLKNFVIDICDCKGTWTPVHFIDNAIEEIRKKVGDTDKVVMGLSGGVDSSVAAVLIDKAIGDRLYCIFVDNGLLRKNEFEDVLKSYEKLGLNVKGVDAHKEFYSALKGLSDPEEKRKAIGKVFIDIFDAEAQKIEGVAYLGQGTIYPDVIESISVKGPSATIKSHHNVGGLPDTMHLKVLEPINMLFKDEVRRVGHSLEIPKAILGRHPFPGPGLAIRILGDITAEKVSIIQETDAIFINGLKEDGLYDSVWQAGAILLPVQSVGVMGDERTYENAVCLRAVHSTDGMTADWVHLPYEFLSKVSNRIINQVKGINRVVYDISSKPPATIEWE